MNGERCGCDESNELRAELEQLRQELAELRTAAAFGMRLDVLEALAPGRPAMDRRNPVEPARCGDCRFWNLPDLPGSMPLRECHEGERHSRGIVYVRRETVAPSVCFEPRRCGFDRQTFFCWRHRGHEGPCFEPQPSTGGAS